MLTVWILYFHAITGLPHTHQLCTVLGRGTLCKNAAPKQTRAISLFGLVFRWAESLSAIWKSTWRHSVSAERGPIWIKFRRLVHNNMSIDCGDMVKIETKCRIPIWRTFGRIHGMSSHCHLPHCRVLPPGEFNVMIPQSYVSHCRVLPPGEFNGMSFQSHVSHCRVLPLGEFTVMILEPHATLQGAATWWIHCHDSRATCHIAARCSHLAKSMSWSWYIAECNNSIHHLKIVFGHILFF